MLENKIDEVLNKKFKIQPKKPNNKKSNSLINNNIFHLNRIDSLKEDRDKRNNKQKNKAT